MGCSLPGSSNHGILQGLNPGLIPSALVVGLFFITITTWEAPPPSSLYLPQKTNIIIPLCFITSVQFSSVQSNCSVISDSLRPQESQHARPPCPSPTPGVDSNSCPSSRWCHLVISSSVVPFSSCPQSLPASGSFPMSQLFASGGQSIGVSASASVLPMNTQDWSPPGQF